MVDLRKLSTLVGACKEVGFAELAKDFNNLRGRALGRSFCDFTYECKQIVDMSSGKYPVEFLNYLNEIITKDSCLS